VKALIFIKTTNKDDMFYSVYHIIFKKTKLSQESFYLKK